MDIVEMSALRYSSTIIISLIFSQLIRFWGGMKSVVKDNSTLYHTKDVLAAISR